MENAIGETVLVIGEREELLAQAAALLEREIAHRRTCEAARPPRSGFVRSQGASAHAH